MSSEIYALIDPRNNETRYVGVSFDSKDRYSKHMYSARSGHVCHKCAWLRQVLSCGLLPELRVLQVIPDELRGLAEIEWIASLTKQGAKLTNATTGGENKYRLSAEARAKISSTQLGRVRSEQEIAKQRETASVKRMSRPQRLKIAFDRTYTSPELREVRRNTNLGRTHSEEQVERNRQARLKEWQDPNHQEKMSRSHKEQIAREGTHFTSEFAKALWQDPEYRAKNLAARKPLRHTEETKSKIAEKMKVIRANSRRS